MYKTLIVGRAGSGKDLIAKKLEDKYGWTFVQSYTTRPRRTETEHGHTFITKEEAEKFRKSEIATDAVLNDNYYFSTIRQIEECDGYIVNPKAIPDLLSACPDVYFQIIYIRPKDDETRYEMAVKRANESDDPDKTLQAYKDRDSDEYEEFTRFEERIASNEVHGNMHECVSLTNTYTIEIVDQIADMAESMRRFHKNMRKILHVIERHGILEVDKDIEFEKTDLLFNINDPVYRLAKLSTNPDDNDALLEFMSNNDAPSAPGRMNVETFIQALYHTIKLPESPMALFMQIWLSTCDAYGLVSDTDTPNISTITVNGTVFGIIKTLYRIENDETPRPIQYHIIQEQKETYVCVKDGENTSQILLKTDFHETEADCRNAIDDPETSPPDETDE